MEANIEIKKLQALHTQALIAKELFWKEKSRNKFYTDKDRNTTYFHPTVNENRRKQASRFKLDDNSDKWTTDKNIIHDTIVYYFNIQLIEEPVEEVSYILRVISKIISPTLVQ